MTTIFSLNPTRFNLIYSYEHLATFLWNKLLFQLNWIKYAKCYFIFINIITGL